MYSASSKKNRLCVRGPMWVSCLLGFLTMSAFATNSLPVIDAETLLAALQHSESLLMSGLVEMVTNAPAGVERTLFAFKGNSMFLTFLEGGPEGSPEPEGRRYLYSYFDGKLSIAFMLPERNVRPTNPTNVAIGHGRRPSLRYTENPLNWGLRYEHIPWSQYLRDHGIQHISTRKEPILELKDVFDCYVARTTSHGMPLRVWFCPALGFHCVRIEEENTWGEGSGEDQKSYPIVNVTRIVPQQYVLPDGTMLWFPWKARLTTKLKDGERVFAGGTIEITRFEPNVDVSAWLDPGIAPDTEVWDGTLGRYLPFKELEWNP